MNHRQPLINTICLALAEYIGDRDDVPLFDIVHALDNVRERIVESFIDEHPELVPQLSAILESTKH